MKKTDRQILDLIGLFNRLASLKIDSHTRYAIARNLQALEPLRDAAIKAFPVPVHPGKDAEADKLKEFTEAESKWLKDLEGEPREFTEYQFTKVPEFTDNVLAAELKKQGLTQDEIDQAVARLDQAIMFGLREFIKE